MPGDEHGGCPVTARQERQIQAAREESEARDRRHGVVRPTVSSVAFATALGAYARGDQAAALWFLRRAQRTLRQRFYDAQAEAVR